MQVVINIFHYKYQFLSRYPFASVPLQIHLDSSNLFSSSLWHRNLFKHQRLLSIEEGAMPNMLEKGPFNQHIIPEADHFHETGLDNSGSIPFMFLLSLGVIVAFFAFLLHKRRKRPRAGFMKRQRIKQLESYRRHIYSSP